MPTPIEAAAKAAVLIEALPWLKRFHDQIIVVKFGGNAMVDDDLTRAFAEDMVYLALAGVKPVVVHGGGPQITAELASRGIRSEFRGGYRVTTAESMPIIRDVLAEVGGTVAASINEHGEFARVASGEDVFAGARRGKVVDGSLIDVGLVGDVESVLPETVLEHVASGLIPVISSVAKGPDGLLNVNADAAAAALAISLGAVKLVILTDVAGLYSDWPNRDSLVSIITADELRVLLASLESGMIPKMTACLDAVAGGVPKAAVIDGRVPHSILIEVFTQHGIGTEVIPDDMA